MGRKLPSWQIHGKIDWRVTSSATVNGLTCTASTVTLLHAFNNLSQSTNSQIIMTAAHGGTTSAQYLRDFDNAAMSSGTNVAIDDLSWDLASDTEANHQWKYTMTVRQVSPE
jgi:hypothetical protein